MIIAGGSARNKPQHTYNGRKKRNSIVHPTHHKHSPSQVQKKLRLQHMVKKMSKQEQDLCEETFEEIDEDGSGTIDMDELSRAMHVLTGSYPSRRLVKAMFATVDDDDNGAINLDEFKILWQMQIEFRKRLAFESKSESPFLPKEDDPLLKLYYIFDDPSKSKVGSYLSIFITFIILVSVTCFIIESLPAFRFWTGGVAGRGQYESLPIFGHIELFSIIVFTIEYLVRFFLVGYAPPNDKPAKTKLRNFVTETLNLIDLVAILPFYIEVAAAGFGATDSGGSGLAVLRILRVARVFRIFKLGKYSSGMQMFAVVMIKSFDALALLSFFLILVIILFGALIYFCEAGIDNYNHELGGFARLDITGHSYELSPFTSIPASFWWVLVTATTVGYGDMYPTSFEGKMIATACMMVGVLALALPVSVIGANFADIYSKKQKQVLQNEQRMLVQMWKGQIGDDEGAEHTRVNENGSIEKIVVNKDRADSEDHPEQMKDELLKILRSIKELSDKATLIMSSIETHEVRNEIQMKRDNNCKKVDEVQTTLLPPPPPKKEI